MTKIGLYGSGWRAEFFLRIAKFLPELFKITGVVTTNEEKAAWYTREFGVNCYKTPAQMLATSPDFVVVSIKASAAMDVSLSLLGQGMPVLLETPAAVNLESLRHFNNSLPKGAKIQVAEQFHFHPMHAARLAYLKQGKIGTPVHVQVSFIHAFHAMSLIRKFLNINFEDTEITAKTFKVPVVAGYTREGSPAEEVIVEKTQTVAVLDFGGKTALLNHEVDQHRSWVRSPIIQVKGERGELFCNKIKYLVDYITPIESEFIRKDLGREENFEGFDLKGVLADGEWLYRNPYQGSRLCDDEIAIATCLTAMAEYVKGGPAFYSLAEASQDTYLGIMVEEAAKAGRAISTETQCWAV